MNNELQLSFRNCIRSDLSNNTNPFDGLLRLFKIYYEMPANKIADFKRRTTKNKGDIFEEFCVLYLKSRYPNWQVWRLKDLPPHYLLKFNLKSFDTGIDLICINEWIVKGKNNSPDKSYYFTYAVQCKYRKENAKKEYAGLTWKSLSTFYATCARTYNWDKLIVMTTADYVRRFGRKNSKDWTFCKNTFCATKRHVWDNLLGDVGYKLNDNKEDERMRDEVKRDEEKRDENIRDEEKRDENIRDEEKRDDKTANIRLLRKAFLDKLTVSKPQDDE
jgi:hypothetical protein